MTVFRVDPKNVTSKRLLFTAQEAKHLRAMRHKKGDVIRVSDGLSTEYEVLLTEVTHKGAAGVIQERSRPPDDRVTIHLGQAVPKGEKLDWVVEKSVELGVHAIHPVLAERSVPRIEERRAADRHERWRRVAEAARKQCGRLRTPEIRPIDSLASFLEATENADLKIVFHESASLGLREVLAKVESASVVALLVGPEGGFSGAEIRAAEAAGFVAASLGKKILRAETAPIAALAIVGYVLGDIGEAATD